MDCPRLTIGKQEVKITEEATINLEKVDLKLTVPKWTGCTYRRPYINDNGEIISYCHNPHNPGAELARMWSPYCMKDKCDL